MEVAKLGVYNFMEPEGGLWLLKRVGGKGKPSRTAVLIAPVPLSHCQLFVMSKCGDNDERKTCPQATPQQRLLVIVAIAKLIVC